MNGPNAHPREIAPFAFESRLVEVRPDGSVRIKMGPWVWLETLVVDARPPKEWEKGK